MSAAEYAGRSRDDLIQELENQRRLAAENLSKMRTAVAEQMAKVTRIREEAEDKLKELDDELTRLSSVVDEGALEVEISFEPPADSANLHSEDEPV